MSDPGDDKRRALLAAAESIPERCRLVERSEGSALTRKIRKLSAFGSRYALWAAARAGWPLGEVSFPLFWGRHVRMNYSDDADFVTFYLTGAPGGPEYKLVRWLIRTLKKDDRFYDAGANHGFYTMLAAELIGGGGEIHAFEPMPEVKAALVKNAPEATVIEAALWDKTGEATLYRNPLSSSLSTLEPGVDAFHATHADKSYAVPTTTLDDYARGKKPPTVIKIDVEGGEKRLIAGAAQTLKSARPAVAMEGWSGEAGERFSVPAIDALIAQGYDAHEITENGSLQALPAPMLASYLRALPGFWDNLVFLPR